ncbi:MAG: hypothetical protein ACD_4C00484G0001 [uncultured bacterium (gcode 4)]|uniref:Uncharacterized protein n=1 Tax=uncultured bacterium (gcode 4) TaxID=1234023 RepID=K2FSV2_9BACT|nr:MAG: hypothetical protein ACD_4C00484G0001 [uncultured bacterium (gcode 4)]
MLATQIDINDKQIETQENIDSSKKIRNEAIIKSITSSSSLPIKIDYPKDTLSKSIKIPAEISFDVQNQSIVIWNSLYKINISKLVTDDWIHPNNVLIDSLQINGSNFELSWSWVAPWFLSITWRQKSDKPKLLEKKEVAEIILELVENGKYIYNKPDLKFEIIKVS